MMAGRGSRVRMKKKITLACMHRLILHMTMPFWPLAPNTKRSCTLHILIWRFFWQIKNLQKNNRQIKVCNLTNYFNECNFFFRIQTRLQSENCDWTDPGYGQTKRFTSRISQQEKKWCKSVQEWDSLLLLAYIVSITTTV